MRIMILSLVFLLPTVPAGAAPVASAVIADPAPDAAVPADVDAFVLPAKDGAMNALVYTASGTGPHPTLLLLHGFPGNEQNLDLAQAARRAGWNVLTLHYRGSWGSPGRFSLGGAAEDAHTALAFLFDPKTIAKYRIDPAHVVVAGHSMGGFMAADAAADEARVAGLALIDAWDISDTARSLATAKGQADWQAEAAGDLPPLAGTSADALANEMKVGGARFDLNRRIAAYGKRPLSIFGASRGVGGDAELAAAAAAMSAGNKTVSAILMPTDHSFSDHRIALADALVKWLANVSAVPQP
jgi:pimeloyl-ACP methyl ester carboxylesterase